MEKQDELLIASYYALTWWAETLNQRHFESPAFDAMPFRDAFVKSRLQSGEGPIALLMPSLYVALVLPRETIFDQYASDFEAIDRQLGRFARNVKTTYKKEKEGNIAFTRHIRNAVSHARTEWMGDGARFHDENTKTSEAFSAEIGIQGLNWLMSALQQIVLKRVRDIQIRQASDNNA
ncbi:hypothetical protein AVKW3434_19260 [Acidovorax sp. SUPP3434]|uniref:hypothetical protein n=1 Tax=Acidovorax sp. SUPP3434 TaxID=2920880 RepID=UPI0023DE3802|nr:hypothetical protein [Acidovorax sp. SUPP3434]GKT01563.1 hypothetical protein AVKW3434_19260 [Acidovorax sp. SUPP3434]